MHIKLLHHVLHEAFSLSQASSSLLSGRVGLVAGGGALPFDVPSAGLGCGLGCDLAGFCLEVTACDFLDDASFAAASSSLLS